MIYKLLNKNANLEVVRDDADIVTLNIIEHPGQDCEYSSYFILGEQDIYDLVGILTELRKRIINDQKNK